MASAGDHRARSGENAQLARRLATDSDSSARRWAVVMAYYAVMDALQAVAADAGEQRIHHDDIIEIPADYDLPDHKKIERQTRELYRFCNRARYLRGSNASASAWFMPFTSSADDLVNQAIQMMDEVLTGL